MTFQLFMHIHVQISHLHQLPRPKYGNWLYMYQVWLLAMVVSVDSKLGSVRDSTSPYTLPHDYTTGTVIHNPP